MLYDALKRDSYAMRKPLHGAKHVAKCMMPLYCLNFQQTPPAACREGGEKS
jgi:hypothetical protein